MSAEIAANLKGRTALVTGATSGIGKEVAQALARMGARVVLTARDRGRGEATRDAIAAATGARDLDLRLVDFASLRSIREAAAEIRRDHPELHILVNNAGGWSSARRVTADGIEQTWATNVLGYFLLTQLLLDTLKAGAPSRIVSVASDLARGLDLGDVGFERRPYSGVAAYAQSKQANRMWTWALARRLAGSGVTANAMHPGGVATGIFTKGGGLFGRAIGVLSGLFARTPAQGADTVIWLAASPDVEGQTGLFFKDRKPAPCAYRNQEQEERLWSLCESMTAPTTAGMGSGGTRS
jgi:NAD(P)-dependent dehydrogenase (short-subunit alcohol dehydrogenase family)